MVMYFRIVRATSHRDGNIPITFREENEDVDVWVFKRRGPPFATVIDLLEANERTTFRFNALMDEMKIDLTKL